jgi:hypothetical protein
VYQDTDSLDHSGGIRSQVNMIENAGKKGAGRMRCALMEANQSMICRI